MGKKVIINGFNKIFMPARNINKRTNPYITLRTAARIRSKHLENLPDSTPDGGNYLSRQITKSKTGAYTEEVLYRSSVKQINYYNDKNEKIKSKDIRLSAGIKKTTEKRYNAEGKIKHIETESLSVTTGKKHIQKCDINPETEKITKYEMIDTNGKTFAMFERDNDGLFITHLIDNNGNEFKHNTESWISTMTDKKTGKTKEGSYRTASDFYSYIRSQIHIDMKKYL